ncbi:MAG: hypothetical protein J6J23_03830 [Clostridia bacterium]|nr:hypothetical protein [Clostridia bacterium]
MAIRAGIIQVCINNNHLASIYNLLAKGTERAKFLTSDDLQLLSALVSYYYSQDEQYVSSNFTYADRSGRKQLRRTIPTFYAMPYRAEKRPWGFVYSNEFLSRYRGVHRKCLLRFGKKWDSNVNEKRIRFAKSLFNAKLSSSIIVDDFVTDLYLTATEQVLDETRYRDFITSNPSRLLGTEMQKEVGLSSEEIKDWIDSQFYIMKDVGEIESGKMLNDLLDLLGEYFDSGLPYLLYYQRTWGTPDIALKLKFSNEEKERFKRAFQLAIKEFAKTGRVQVNNSSYHQLEKLMEEESEASA